MKKRVFAVFCVLMLILSGCSGKETDAPDAEAGPDMEDAPEPTKQAAIFVPDEQAEYLQGAYITVRANDPLPGQLISGLIDARALPEDVEILDCQFRFMDGKFELNLNEAFLTAMRGSGSAGETMLLYSVVDTFLFNYPTAHSLVLTADGKSIETEHGVYDEPFSELQYLRQ